MTSGDDGPANGRGGAGGAADQEKPEDGSCCIGPGKPLLAWRCTMGW
jgi:hypothetical protein